MDSIELELPGGTILRFTPGEYQKYIEILRDEYWCRAEANYHPHLKTGHNYTKTITVTGQWLNDRANRTRRDILGEFARADHGTWGIRAPGEKWDE